MVYNNGGGSSIGGLTSGTVYYVIPASTTEVRLASSHADAVAGTALVFTSAGGSGQSLEQVDAAAKTFNATSSVDSTNNSIDPGYSPGFTTGEEVVYDNGGSGDIPGLISGQVYYVASGSSGETLQLSTTATRATSNKLISLSDSTTATSSGGVEVQATESSTINTTAVAVATSVSVAAFSGSGAYDTNTTSNTVSAYVAGGATVHATGPDSADTVQTDAVDDLAITSNIGTGALAIGFVGGSLGVSVTTNTIGDNVSAYINDATVTAYGQDIDVYANYDGSTSGVTVATAVALSQGGSIAGGYASSTDNTNTDSYIDSGADIDTEGYGADLADSFGTINVDSTSADSISTTTDERRGRGLRRRRLRRPPRQ